MPVCADVLRVIPLVTVMAWATPWRCRATTIERLTGLSSSYTTCALSSLNLASMEEVVGHAIQLVNRALLSENYSPNLQQGHAGFAGQERQLVHFRRSSARCIFTVAATPRSSVAMSWSFAAVTWLSSATMQNQPCVMCMCR